MAYNNYLDWYNIFVNEFAGSPELFVFLVFLTISILLAKFKATTQIYLIVLTATSLILGAYFNMLLVIAGLAIFGFIGIMLMRIRRE